MRLKDFLFFGFALAGMTILLMMAYATEERTIERLATIEAQQKAILENQHLLSAGQTSLGKIVQQLADIQQMRATSRTGRCDPNIIAMAETHRSNSLRVLSDKELIRQIQRESSCDPWAHNGVAYGLMGVKPETAFPGMPRAEAIKLLMDPETSIMQGLGILDGYYRQTGDKVKALQSYSYGITRVLRDGVMSREYPRAILGKGQVPLP